MSPTPARGRRFRRAPIPLTEMMYRLRAPELSQQLRTAPLVFVSFGIRLHIDSGVQRTWEDPWTSSTCCRRHHHDYSISFFLFFFLSIFEGSSVSVCPSVCSSVCLHLLRLPPPCQSMHRFHHAIFFLPTSIFPTAATTAATNSRKNNTHTDKHTRSPKTQARNSPSLRHVG